MSALADNTYGWLMVAGLVLLAVSGKSSIAWGSGWVWPVPPLRYPRSPTYPPVITNGFAGAKHAGVDIMYDRGAGADRYFAPSTTPIVAARDGTVWSVDKSPRGWQVVIDHGAPFATYYQHLSQVALEPHAKGVNLATGKPTRVVAGEQIGRMGADPLDPEGLRHLHFAVWYKGYGDAASVDPAAAMASWPKPAPWEVA